MLSDFLEFNPFHPKPLHIQYSAEFLDAVKFGKHEIVKNALKTNEAFLFCYDYYRQTAYHWAAKLGDLKMLEILVKKGKYVNQYDDKKRTPIYLASLNNQFECCEYLLKNLGNCFMEDINGKKPIDVATDPRIKILLSDQMDNKYNNPIIRNKVNMLLKSRDDLISKRKEEKDLVKGAEDKMKREIESKESKDSA